MFIKWPFTNDLIALVCFTKVGGIEEYKICDALKSGRLFKPIVAWCIGTCAKLFTSEVQFGHAGACANAERETADAKNQVLYRPITVCNGTLSYSMVIKGWSWFLAS